MRMTGPAMSLGESAETQLWSSGFSSGSGSVVLRDLEIGASLSAVRVLRFLGLSPLNVRGFTILVVRVGGWGLELSGWSLMGFGGGRVKLWSLRSRYNAVDVNRSVILSYGFV